MPYPGRPVLQVLPEFVGTRSTRQTHEQRVRLLDFCAEQYLILSILGVLSSAFLVIMIVIAGQHQAETYNQIANQIGG